MSEYINPALKVERLWKCSRRRGERFAVTTIINFFQKMNRKDQIGTVVGIVASTSGIILWAILNFFNPYSTKGITEAMIKITFMGLGLPAISGLVASVFKIKWLMYAVFIASLPLSLYLAGTPSIFKLFLLVSLFYLVSAILLT